MASRRRWLRGRTLTMLGLAAAGCAAAGAGCGASHRAVFTAPRSLTPQGHSRSRTASDPLSRRRVYVGGSVEHRFARLSGLPLRRLTRYPGSAAGWQNHRLPGTTAFVVELPGGTLSPARVSRYAAAVRALSRF